MKAKTKKSFYSCIDSLFMGINAEQHDVINTMANRENGKIIFYGAEDFFVAANQPFILTKLMRTKNWEFAELKSGCSSAGSQD